MLTREPAEVGLVDCRAPRPPGDFERWPVVAAGDHAERLFKVLATEALFRGRNLFTRSVLLESQEMIPNEFTDI